MRKQTLTNAERYITPELKELEDTILGAEDKLLLPGVRDLYYEVRDNGGGPDRSGFRQLPRPWRRWMYLPPLL